MITAGMLGKKLDKDGAEHVCEVEGHGNLTFVRKTKNNYSVYNGSDESLARGTLTQILSFLYREEKEKKVPSELVPVKEKPVEAAGDGEEVSKEEPKTETLFVPEQRGKGTGPGTRFRARIFGLPCTAIVRWMWKNGFSFAEIKKALEILLPDGQPQDTTLHLQRNALRKGAKTAPELAKVDADKLFALRSGVQAQIKV